MRVTYVYQTKHTKALTELFCSVHEDVTYKKINTHILKLTYNPYISEEPIDYENLHALILSDFTIDVAIVDLPEEALNFIKEDTILDTIKTIPKKAYDVDDLCFILIEDKAIKAQLKAALKNYLGEDLIISALAIAKANMNLSTAATKSYIHRNTLNYRIDKIFEKTGIDVRTFKGLSIFTMLYGL